MNSNAQMLLFTLLVIGASVTAFVLLVVFVAVPVFRGLGAAISMIFRGIGWFIMHICEFVAGILGDVRKQVAAQTPLGRIGQVEDIAPAAVFFASPDAAWITGETLRIAGGLG